MPSFCQSIECTPSLSHEAGEDDVLLREMLMGAKWSERIPVANWMVAGAWRACTRNVPHYWQR